MLAILGMGASLLPDLDHARSTATQALGDPVHRGVRWIARRVREESCHPCDRDYVEWRCGKQKGWDPDHRGFTHTVIAGAAFALLAGLLSELGVVFNSILVGLCAGLALRAFTRGVGVIVGVILSCSVVFVLPVTPTWASIAVFVGWMSHLLADGFTKDGVPLAWPLTWRGRRWRNYRLMGRVLESGSRAEWWVAGALVSLLSIPVFIA